MDHLPEDICLKFNPDTLEAVRTMYELEKPGAMSAAVDILEEWATKQQHFVEKNFNRGYLERLIITCKGSVEGAKARLDKVCTLRTLAPNYFVDCDIRKDYEDIEGKIISVPLSKLTKAHERVCIIKTIGTNFSTQMLFSGFRICTKVTEYLKAHDYANYYVVVGDLRECSTSNLVTSMNIFDIRKFMLIIMEGYGFRIKGIHIVTSSKMVEALVGVLKQIFNEKIGGRIHVHQNFESIYEVVPKDVLPTEYGGEEVPLEELNKKWMKILTSQEFREYCKEINSACTDESLRQKDQFNEQYMGMPGTFRTLNVD